MEVELIDRAHTFVFTRVSCEFWQEMQKSIPRLHGCSSGERKTIYIYLGIGKVEDIEK